MNGLRHDLLTKIISAFYKFAEHSSGLFNDGSALFAATGLRPLLILFRIIQMKTDQVVAISTPELFFELLPELLALIINL